MAYLPARGDGEGDQNSPVCSSRMYSASPPWSVTGSSFQGVTKLVTVLGPGIGASAFGHDGAELWIRDDVDPGRRRTLMGPSSVTYSARPD